MHPATPSVNGRHHARIFLLSHMRAYTSLAGHILGSHSQINGYYEMHISYDDASALDRQLEVFLEGDVLKPNSRYLFDKLLHNDYRLLPERLGSIPIKLLLCVNDPEHSLRSIVALFRRKCQADPYATPGGAAAYLISRLQALAEFAERHSGEYVYFDAGLWQTAPETLLARLTDWLGLSSPLSAEYRVFSQTGKPRRGDSSPRILSGRIERGRADYSHIAIPEPLLWAARQAHAECRTRLIAHAREALLVDGGAG